MMLTDLWSLRSFELRVLGGGVGANEMISIGFGKSISEGRGGRNDLQINHKVANSCSVNNLFTERKQKVYNL